MNLYQLQPLGIIRPKINYGILTIKIFIFDDIGNSIYS